MRHHRLDRPRSRRAAPLKRRGIPLAGVALAGLLLGIALLPLERGAPTAVPERPGAPARGAGEAADEAKDLTPSEWFHRQRAYPGTEIPRAARLSGFAQAAALRDQAAERAAATASWELAGPTNIGGRITAIGLDPATLAIYAGAADGGILKSTDLGGTWTALFDNQNTLSIGAIACHPGDPDVVLVGTGEPNASGDSYDGTGVYRTTDGGSSWEHLGLTESRHIGRVVFDPRRPDTLYVAALGNLYSTNPERGVYRSPDGGLSWDLVHSVSDSTACVDVAINPDDPDIVYAAMWERIRRPHDRRVGGPTSGIWRSTDAGNTWTLLGNGLPTPGPTVGRIGLAVAPSSPQIVYAIYADHPGFFAGIYKSTDGGDSWSRVNDAGLGNMYSSFGWYFGNIRVHPTDPDRVYALGLDTHRSTNGGSSWSNVTSSIHVDQHDWVFNSNDPSIVVAGNDGGIYTSFTGGSSWTKALNLPITQFYAITVDFQFPDRRYGGTQDNSTMRTLTGALDDWQIILGGDGFYTVVDPIDNNFIYAEFQWGNLFRSTDGGSNFSPATSGISSGDRRNWSTPVVMDPGDNQTLYYGTFKVYRSTDRAASWTAISPDLTDGPGSGSLTFGTVTTIAVAPADPQVIAAGTDDSNVWVTLNGGGSWSPVSATLPDRWCTRVAFDPLAINVVYATFSGYREDVYTPHVFRSTDAGASWTDISSNLPEVPVNVIVIDPGDTQTLYVGTDAGVYVSRDLGGSWAALGTGLPNGVVSDLHLHHPSRTLTAGTHGRSMWKIDVNLTTAVAATAAPGRPSLLGPVRPNPFRTRTGIAVHLTAPAPVTLRVYDVTGRLVAELLDGLLPAGEHRFTWDGATLAGDRAPRGVYLLRLRAGDRVAVRKAILER